MHIILEAPQQSPYITGTDRFACNVLRELQTMDMSNYYEVICTKEFPYIPSVVTASNFRVVYKRRLSRFKKVLRLPRGALSIARKRFVDRPAVLSSFHNMASPALKFCPIVAHALDLIPLIYPDDYYQDPAARRVYRSRVNRTARTADRFIAISNHTKRDLVDRLGIDPQRITVVHLAPDERFRPSNDHARREAVKAKYGLPSRYVFTIGGKEPRKNVQAAIQAFLEMPAELRKQIGLVIAGPSWRGNSYEDSPKLNIRSIGYVDDNDLPTLYGMADAFAFLSLYEGFGMPVLEAMACGTPVVCSNRTSLPEVAGDAAVVVDAEDTSKAADSLSSLLADSDMRTRLVEAGFAHARTFTWRKTAAEIFQVIRDVAAG